MMDMGLLNQQDEKWRQLVKIIPVDLERTALEYKALQRHRCISSAVVLLRLVLMYAFTLSLRATALWAACMGWANISHQALAKCIHRSSEWLGYLIKALLVHHISTLKPLYKTSRTLVIADATTISRPRSPGTEWRLHIRFAPFIQQPIGLLLTDSHQGEHLRCWEIQPEDIILADRGYGTWSNMEQVLEAHADAVIRISWNTFPLVYAESTEEVDLPLLLKDFPPSKGVDRSACCGQR